MKEKEIKDYLQEQYDVLKDIYGENRIMGLFTYGKLNYGFAQTFDDIETVMCYIPTFEDICLGITLKYDEIPFKGKKIRVTDIRNLYERARHQEKIVMEATFSEYAILNPKYEALFKQYIYMNREAIFHANQKKRTLDAVNRGLECLKYYIESDCTKYDYLIEASRIRIATSLYLEGVSIENCINFKKDYLINYMWQIIRGEIEVDIEGLKKELEEMKAKAEELEEENCGNELLRTAILKITSIGIKEEETTFLENITATEKKALDFILSKLDKNYEGNISIVQLINESGISRPVYKNIIDKMKKSNVAEVVNQGTKGTYIKILDMRIISGS